MLRNLINLLKATQRAREAGGIKTRQQSPGSVRHHSLPLLLEVVWSKNMMQIIITLRMCEQCWVGRTQEKVELSLPLSWTFGDLGCVLHLPSQFSDVEQFIQLTRALLRAARPGYAVGAWLKNTGLRGWVWWSALTYGCTCPVDSLIYFFFLTIVFFSINIFKL